MKTPMLVFLATFFICLFILGSLGLGLMKKKASIFSALTWGLVFALAIFQIIAYPLFKLQASFQLLFWCYTVVMAGLLLFGLYRLICGKEIFAYGRCFIEFLREAKKTMVLFILLAVAVGIYSYLALGFQYSTSDDGYYIPRASEVLSMNSLNVSESVAWLGEYVQDWPMNSDVSTLEFFKAYLSYCSGIPVVVLCRNCLNIGLSLLSMAVVYNLAGDLAGEREGVMRIKALTVFFYCILVIISSFVARTSASWSLRYIWQGKAMLCAIIFPMLMSGCAGVVRSGDGPVPKSNWILLAFTLTAGISVSIVGAFLPFICYFILGLPYLLTVGWKKAKTMLLPIFLTALPVIMFSGLTFLDVMTRNTGYLSQYDVPVWSEEFNYMFSSYHYLFLILYLAAIIYVCIRGSRTAKLVCVGAPIVLFLTFLNPLLIEPVSKYITTGIVYWRLYWLLPVYSLPAYVLADAIGRQSLDCVRSMTLAIAYTLAAILGLGAAIKGPKTLLLDMRTDYYNMASTAPRTTLYGLDRQTIDIADAILTDHQGEGKPRLLALDEIANKFRQYTIDIVMAGGVRENMFDMLTGLVQGTDIPQREFYQAFYHGTITDAAYLCEMLKRLDVDYICLNDVTLMPEGIEQTDIQYFTTVGSYTIWKLEPAT